MVVFQRLLISCADSACAAQGSLHLQLFTSAVFQFADSTEENNLHKDLLTSMLILLLVFIIFILLAGYFFRYVCVELCTHCSASRWVDLMRKWKHGVRGVHSLHRSRERAVLLLAAGRRMMNRSSFSRLTWLVKAGLEKHQVPLNVVSQFNVVCVFKVPETQESCGELWWQEDAKWNLRGAR